jgi:hypothetical protein
VAYSSNTMDMDLDFHIEFPSPDANCNNEGRRNGAGPADTKDVIMDNNDNDGLSLVEKIWPVPGYEDKDTTTATNLDKEVVVIMLGWAGSQHKHVAKYSDIYLRRG